MQREIARERLDLVVCPELFMSGYNVGNEIAALAEPRGGPYAARIAELARSNGTAIVYGYPERDGELVYNAATCIGADGGAVANHRKLLLPPGFEENVFAPASGLTLFTLEGARCAMLICYDAEYPEALRAAAEAGAEVVIVPTALAENWSTVALQLMPTRAFENGVWLLYANHAGEENGANYFGGSCIVAPDGKDAARAGPQEELIVADVDLSRVSAAQQRLPYVKQVEEMRRRLAARAGGS